MTPRRLTNASLAVAALTLMLAGCSLTLETIARVDRHSDVVRQDAVGVTDTRDVSDVAQFDSVSDETTASDVVSGDTFFTDTQIVDIAAADARLDVVNPPDAVLID